MAEKKTAKLPPKYQEWVDARKRHRLSHAHVQMARELGFLPKSLRKIDDHQNKPWKAPLKEYIEDLYFKKFKRQRPQTVLTIEQMAQLAKLKKIDQKGAKGNALPQESTDPDSQGVQRSEVHHPESGG